VGSAPYLAPEQAPGETAGPRSDVYGLGVVLYQMLAGRPPFEAESPVAVAFKHLEEPPAPPSSHQSGIPPDLDRVVLRALAKDPDDRFGSAEAFLAALRPFTEDHDTRSVAEGAHGRRRRWGRGGGIRGGPVPDAAPVGRPAAIALVALVVAVAATLLGATRSPGQVPAEVTPRPSVSVPSLPAMDPATPSSPGQGSREEGDEEEGGGGDQGGS
jgi:hypothetical protein